MNIRSIKNLFLLILKFFRIFFLMNINIKSIYFLIFLIFRYASLHPDKWTLYNNYELDYKYTEHDFYMTKWIN